jgi:hypothetical protein
MKMAKIRMAFVLAVAVLALLQTAAMAADSKNAAQPKYKKVTGKVVSASPTSIVIKGRSKDPLTLAITGRTKTSGAVKAGDKAEVNYRSDESGNTATKITVLSAPDKSDSPRPTPASASTSPGTN